MTIIYGQAVMHKDGGVIPSWYTVGFNCTGKSAAHVKGAIVRQLKRKVRKEGATFGELYLHYSTSTNGPFLTQSKGVYKP